MLSNLQFAHYTEFSFTNTFFGFCENIFGVNISKSISGSQLWKSIYATQFTDCPLHRNFFHINSFFIGFCENIFGVNITKSIIVSQL